MKKSFIIVLAIVVFVGVAPHFIGSKAEDELRAMYAKMSSTPELTVEVTDYQRGWFNSSARVVMSINMAEIDPSVSEQMQLVMNHELQHGPFLTQSLGFGIGLMDIGTQLEFPAFMKEEFPDLDTMVNDALDIEARMGFDGTIEGDYTLNEFNIDEDNTQVFVKAATVTALATPEGHVKGEGSWQGMTATDNRSFNLTIGNSTTVFDMQAIGGSLYNAGGLFTGTSKFEMSELDISSQDMPGNLVITNINMYSNTEVNDDLMNMQLDMGADQVDIMGQAFTDLMFDQTFANLDMETLQQLNELGQNSQNLTESELQQLQQLAMQALAKKPTWSVNQVGVTTPQGPIRAEMTMTLNEQAVDFNSPESLATALLVDASGYIPEAFLNGMGVGAMVQPIIEQGLLQREGENITFEVSYKQGQLMMFGKPAAMNL